MTASDSSDTPPLPHHAASSELERRATELHRLLLESVHDYAIYALTASGHVATWNPGAERLKGFQANEIVGKHFSTFYPPEQRTSERPARELEIAASEGRFEEEAWRVRKDGSPFWASVIVSPIRAASGELLGFAKITRDLTKNREAELRQRELEVARAAAEAARDAEEEARRIATLLQQQSAELEARNEEAQALAEELELSNEELQNAATAAEDARESAELARQHAERNSARLSQLQRVAERLSQALDVASTTEAIVDEAIQTVGADAAYVASRCPNPDELELVHGHGYAQPFEHARMRFSAHDHLPGSDVVRAAQALWIESHAARNAAYPVLTNHPVSGRFGASATLPLSVEGETVGAVGMHFFAERQFDDDARAFLRAFAEQAALSMARARLFEAERRARNIAERLQSVTAALSKAATPAQVTDIVVSAGLQTLGAGAGFVALVSEDRTTLDILRAVGYSDELVSPFRSMPIAHTTPITDAVRSGEPVWITSPDEAQARYPALKLVGSEPRFQSWAALPLIVDGVVRGALGLSFEHETAVALEQRDLMLSLARQCAQALERARLFDAEQRARREAHAGQARAEFLAEASRQLGSSLDYDTTLESVARAAVPRLGDWCAIDMLADYSTNSWPPVMKRLAVMHSDPAKIEWARELEKRQPPDWDAPTGVPRVMREGVSEFYPVITDEMLVAAAKSEEELALLRAVGFSAYICVPLKVRGRTVGVITLVMAESKRPYTEADLTLAEELATRASLAIENADLFREAQQANAAKAQFLAVMSHELRTPLNAIGGYAELLELGVRGQLTEEQAHDIQRIKRSQHHLLALINDVLNFARIEAGHVQYNCQQIPLAGILEEVVSLLIPQANARQLAIEISHCPNDATAYADSEKVQQVLLNLLSNAVKFTLPGGTVRIGCAVHKHTVDIDVSDTGIGIPDDRLSAIFDPFVQVQSGLTRSAEGTGLGLSISRDLARGMRGDLRVQSVLGAGSTFTLSLPCKAP